jgi:DNA-binding MarR family transcriptional regulator
MARREKTSASWRRGGRKNAVVALGLENLVGYNLRRAHGVQRQRFAHVFGPHGIRPVLLSILGLIHDSPNLKQADLGRKLDIKRANVVALLDDLQERGLITRCFADGDRRSYVLALTPSGKTLTRKLLDLHTRLEEHLIEGLGLRERDQLLQLLKKFQRLDPRPDLEDE